MLIFRRLTLLLSLPCVSSTIMLYRKHQLARTLLQAVLSFTFLSRCHGQAGLLNITIDDTNGDEKTGVLPVYIPLEDWTPEPGCTQCVVKPDPTQALDHTWHDTSHFPTNPDQLSIQINFTGVAVYAYFIIANNVFNASTLTNMTFFLDGNPAGSFLHLPTNGPEYEYNVTGFTQSNLENTEHQLIIQTAGTTNTSLVLFDYVIYSVPTNVMSSIASTVSSTTSTSATVSSSPSPSSSAAPTSNHSNAGAIAGGVVGGIVGLLLVASAVLLYLRRRKTQELPPETDHSHVIHPFSQKDSSFVPDSPSPATGGSPAPAGTKFSSYNAQSDSYVGGSILSTQSPESPSTRVAYGRADDQMTAREDYIRPSGAAAPSSPSLPGVSHLRGEVVALQAELENLRANQEVLRMNVDAPPRYDS